jgi:D-alanyl-D-alanine carboxypeptidase (penicillin-binding protein 5/6)
VPNGGSGSCRAARCTRAVLAIVFACLFAVGSFEFEGAGLAGAAGQASATGTAPGAPGTGAGSPPAQAGPPSAPPAKGQLPASRSYVLVDVGTGNVLAGYREHERVRPASLTKVLTAVIAVSYLGPGGRVAGTAQSAAAYPNRVGMEKGVPWPLGEVLQSLLVYSANDAAYAIADRIGGSLAGFVPVMERSAKEMGMSDHPLFNDPAGLDGTEGFRGGNLVSARDLAIAGRDLLHVPELAKIVRERGYHFVDPAGQLHWLPSMDYVFLDSYPGAEGIKTGYTDLAGACIMAAATRNGRTMLAVVTDGYNPQQTAIDLLNQGFATPVASERDSDHLPPVSLPYPPGTAHPVAQGAGRRGGLGAGAREGGSLHKDRAASHALREGQAQHRPAVNLADRHAQVAKPDRSSLSQVLSSLLGQVLLGVTALAALIALRELIRADRARRSRCARPYAPLPAKPSRVVTAFSTRRRRRERLVASYTRHERPAGFRARG